MNWEKLARVTAKLELRWWRYASSADAKGEINQSLKDRTLELEMWDRMRRCRMRAAVAADAAGKLDEGSRLYRSELKRLGCYQKPAQ